VMQKAIDNLGIPPDFVLVDGRMKIHTKCPIKCITGGDGKCLSIAAASISVTAGAGVISTGASVGEVSTGVVSPAETARLSRPWLGRS